MVLSALTTACQCSPHNYCSPFFTSYGVHSPHQVPLLDSTRTCQSLKCSKVICTVPLADALLGTALLLPLSRPPVRVLVAAADAAAAAAVAVATAAAAGLAAGTGMPLCQTEAVPGGITDAGAGAAPPLMTAVPAAAGVVAAAVAAAAAAAASAAAVALAPPAAADWLG